jgi:hypothetical protein
MSLSRKLSRLYRKSKYLFLGGSLLVMYHVNTTWRNVGQRISIKNDIPYSQNHIDHRHNQEYSIIEDPNGDFILAESFDGKDKKRIALPGSAGFISEVSDDSDAVFLTQDGRRFAQLGGLEELIETGGNPAKVTLSGLDDDESFFSPDKQHLVCIDDPQNEDYEISVRLFDMKTRQMDDYSHLLVSSSSKAFPRSSDFIQLWWNKDSSGFGFLESGGNRFHYFDIASDRSSELGLPFGTYFVTDGLIEGNDAYLIGFESRKEQDERVSFFRLTHYDLDAGSSETLAMSDRRLANLNLLDREVIYTADTVSGSTIFRTDGKTSQKIGKIDSFIYDLEPGNGSIFIQAGPGFPLEWPYDRFTMNPRANLKRAPRSKISSFNLQTGELDQLVSETFDSFSSSLRFFPQQDRLVFLANDDPFYRFRNMQVNEFDLSTGTQKQLTDFVNQKSVIVREPLDKISYLLPFIFIPCSLIYASSRLRRRKVEKQAGIKKKKALNPLVQFPLLSSVAAFSYIAGAGETISTTQIYSELMNYYPMAQLYAITMLGGIGCPALVAATIINYAASAYRRPFHRTIPKAFGLMMSKKPAVEKARTMLEIQLPGTEAQKHAEYRLAFHSGDYDRAISCLEERTFISESEAGLRDLDLFIQASRKWFDLTDLRRYRRDLAVEEDPKKRTHALLTLALSELNRQDYQRGDSDFLAAIDEAKAIGIDGHVSVLYARVLAMQPEKSAQAEQQWNRSIESIFSHEQHGLQRVSDSKNIVVAPEGSYLEGAFRFKIGSQKALELENQRIQRYEQAYGNSLHSYGIFRVPLKNLVPEDRPLTGVQERIRQMAQETGQDHVPVLATRYHKGSSLTQIVDEYLHDADKQQSLFEAYAHSTVFLGTTLAQEPVPSEAVYSTEDMLRERFERPVSPYSDEQAETIIRNISPVSDLIDCSAYVIDNDPHPDNLMISQDTEGKPVVTEIDLEDKGVVPYAVSLGLFLSYSGVSSKDGSDIRVLSAQQQQTLVDSFVEAYNSQAKNYNRDMIDPSQAHLAAMAGIISTGLSMSVSWSDPKRPSLAPKRMDVLKSALNAIDDIARAPQYRTHYERYQHNYAALQAVMQEKLHELN